MSLTGAIVNFPTYTEQPASQVLARARPNSSLKKTIRKDPAGFRVATAKISVVRSISMTDLEKLTGIKLDAFKDPVNRDALEPFLKKRAPVMQEKYTFRRPSRIPK
jgi:hypothetical protein